MKTRLAFLFLAIMAYSTVSTAQEAAVILELTPDLEVVQKTMPVNPDPATKPVSYRNVVLIQVSIAPSGSVTEAFFLSSSGWRQRDKSAIAAVRDWKFRPALDAKAQAVGTTCTVRMTFL